MAAPLINGRAYDFTQSDVQILGVSVASVTAISYTEEQEKANNFGAGSRPVSRGQGAINASGSITIGMNDIEAIRDAAEDGSLLKIPAFDITVTYLNKQKVITHVLKNVEFLNDGIEAAQNDMNLERSFDIVLSNIVYR